MVYSINTDTRRKGATLRDVGVTNTALTYDATVNTRPMAPPTYGQSRKYRRSVKHGTYQLHSEMATTSRQARTPVANHPSQSRTCDGEC